MKSKVITEAAVRESLDLSKTEIHVDENIVESDEDIDSDMEGDVEENIEDDAEENIEDDAEEDIEDDAEEDIEDDAEEDIEDDAEEDIEDDAEEDIEDDADDEGDNEDGADEKSGWADAMAKVLKSAKTSEPSQVILSKARKDEDVKSKEPVEGGELDKEKEAEEEQRKPKLKQSIIRSHKLAVESVSRQIPNVVRDKVREKSLNKIATKGVVQLFNAVKKQQVDLKKDLNSVGKSIRKREKVYQNLDKESFLENVLGAAKSGSKSTKAPVKSKAKEEQPMEVEEQQDEESGGKTWSVLRDDFMIGAKMKDWDKNSDSE